MEHSPGHIGGVDNPDRLHIPESQLASGNLFAECRIDKSVVPKSHSSAAKRKIPAAEQVSIRLPEIVIFLFPLNEPE